MLNQALRGGAPPIIKIDASSRYAGQRGHWTLDEVLKPLLVADGLAQIWNRLRLALFHIAAVTIAGGNVFINAVIALYQFCKAQISQFPIGFGATDIGAGNEFLDRSCTGWAPGERFVINGLPKIKHLSQCTWFILMLVFINRHTRSLVDLMEFQLPCKGIRIKPPDGADLIIFEL